LAFSSITGFGFALFFFSAFSSFSSYALSSLSNYFFSFNYSSTLGVFESGVVEGTIFALASSLALSASAFSFSNFFVYFLELILQFINLFIISFFHILGILSVLFIIFDYLLSFTKFF